jgi:hypothetical protein
LPHQTATANRAETRGPIDHSAAITVSEIGISGLRKHARTLPDPAEEPSPPEEREHHALVSQGEEVPLRSPEQQSPPDRVRQPHAPLGVEPEPEPETGPRHSFFKALGAARPSPVQGQLCYPPDLGAGSPRTCGRWCISPSPFGCTWAMRLCTYPLTPEKPRP